MYHIELDKLETKVVVANYYFHLAEPPRWAIKKCGDVLVREENKPLVLMILFEICCVECQIKLGEDYHYDITSLLGFA